MMLYLSRFPIQIPSLPPFEGKEARERELVLQVHARTGVARHVDDAFLDPEQLRRQRNPSRLRCDDGADVARLHLPLLLAAWKAQVMESARARPLISRKTTKQLVLFKCADTEKLFLTCLLFKFGCSRSLPFYVASTSVVHSLYSVKKCLTHLVWRQKVSDAP